MNEELPPPESPLTSEFKYGKKVPTGRESQLSDIAWKLYFALLDVETLAKRTLDCPDDQMIPRIKRARQLVADCDLLWEVEGFDIEDKYFDPAGFTQRTGIPTSRKPPLDEAAA